MQKLEEQKNARNSKFRFGPDNACHQILPPYHKWSSNFVLKLPIPDFPILCCDIAEEIFIKRYIRQSSPPNQTEIRHFQWKHRGFSSQKPESTKHVNLPRIQISLILSLLTLVWIKQQNLSNTRYIQKDAQIWKKKQRKILVSKIRYYHHLLI